MFSILLKNKHKKSKKINLKMIITIIGSALVIGVLGYVAIDSMIPVNADHLVFSVPSNIYIKALNSPTGYYFAHQSTKGSKVQSSGYGSPTLQVAKDNLVSIHLINEDNTMSNALSTHNINIDEFNVHSNDLHYFQTQTITFVADKQGEFEYYCTIHPEMKGKIVVE